MANPNNLIYSINPTTGAQEVRSNFHVAQISFRFIGSGFRKNRNNVSLKLVGDNVFSGKVPGQIGSVIMTTLELSQSRTAGSISIIPLSNGNPFGGGALDITISAGDKGKATADPSLDVQFGPSDRLGARGSSSSDWGPESVQLEYTIYYVLQPFLT